MLAGRAGEGAGRVQRRLDGGRCAACSGIETVCLEQLEWSGGGGRGEGGFCGSVFQQENFISCLLYLQQSLVAPSVLSLLPNLITGRCSESGDWKGFWRTRNTVFALNKEHGN